MTNRYKLSEILKNQPIINFGTLGHVACGKSTLVFKITGKKTQQFKKEQDRNITINVGYANAKIFIDNKGKLHTAKSRVDTLDNDDGTPMTLIGHVSFVDSPGHEDFMANMMSGSAVMDGAILVIASNEEIPRPQTVEHMQAVGLIGIDKFIVLQNKMDLINENDNDDIHHEITKYLSKTKANNAQLIPTSIQNGINANEVIKSIVRLSDTKLKEKCNEPARLICIRSFDVNRPSISFDNLTGGVVGGSFVTGMLKKGDVVELRPGLRKKLPNGSYAYCPLISTVVSLQSDERQLDYAFSGGLIGVGLTLDSFFTKNNGMVGQVLGHIGTLPEVYNELEFKLQLLNSDITDDLKFKLNEKLFICGNASKIEGVITMYKNKKDLFKVKLERPLCIDLDQSISVLKYVGSKWKLVGKGELIKGVECKRILMEEDIYNKLLDETQNREEIEVDYDIDYDDYSDYLLEEDYDSLVMNISFQNKKLTKITVVPPSVVYNHPKTIITNYSDLCKSLNKLTYMSQDKINNLNNIFNIKIQNNIDYIDLIKKHMEKELSVTSTLNGKNQLCIRMKLRPKRIADEVRSFINVYLKCFSCSSPLSILQKSNKQLKRYCLTCNSVSTVNRD